MFFNPSIYPPAHVCLHFLSVYFSNCSFFYLSIFPFLPSSVPCFPFLYSLSFVHSIFFFVSAWLRLLSFSFPFIPSFFLILYLPFLSFRIFNPYILRFSSFPLFPPSLLPFHLSVYFLSFFLTFLFISCHYLLILSFLSDLCLISLVIYFSLSTFLCTFHLFSIPFSFRSLRFPFSSIDPYISVDSFITLPVHSFLRFPCCHPFWLLSIFPSSFRLLICPASFLPPFSVHFPRSVLTQHDTPLSHHAPIKHTRDNPGHTSHLSPLHL